MSDSTTMSHYADALNLKGRGFVVLGAGGGGMGTQTSLALAAAGADLLCVDFREDQANEIAAATGGTAHVANVNARDDMLKIFDRAEQLFGDRLKGIVDIVGGTQLGSLPSHDDAAIQTQFDLVFRHALLAMQIGAPRLAANGGGSMVFIGSISGITAMPNVGLYGVAKAALHHLIRQGAFEFAPQGVRVNGIAPGFVKTPRFIAAMSEEGWRDLALTIPMRRAAEPSDIARAALFLSSDLAGYVTGNILTLDGGAISYFQTPPIRTG